MEASTWLQKKNIDLIFTTAYPEYAIEGYELDVLDYLLKPIIFNRFLKSALKAQEYLGLRTSHEVSASPEFFFIKCNQKIEKIKINDVLYIEGMSNYVIVHTLQRKYISYLTSKSIEEQLPHNLFVHIHKSFLVAVNCIDGNEVKVGKFTWVHFKFSH